MNFRRISDSNLADFSANILTLLGGTTLSAINTPARTALVAALGSLPTDFNDQVRSASNVEGARMAAVSLKNATREQVIALLSQVRNALLAGLAPKEQYDLCGFDYRNGPSGPYQAQDPGDLSAFGYSNGVNTIKFKGNNGPGSVVYEIWRRQGDTGAWALLATTKKQTFTDTPVTPGQYYEYKVRATAAKSVSNFSNSAVVYGV